MKKIILLLILITNISAAESMNMIGEKGKVNEVDRIIEVKMYDTFYEPSEFKIKKNETIKFVVSRNTSGNGSLALYRGTRCGSYGLNT